MAVIGVGQIGGSVALGARVAGAVTEVVAWSRTPEKLDRAQALGIIDRAAPLDGRGGARRRRRGAGDAGAQPGRGGRGRSRRELEEGALVFDVGSVKGAAIAVGRAQAAAGRLRRLPPDRGHRAGRSRRGQPAAVRGQALRDLSDAAEPRGGGGDGRAAVDGDGRRAGAHDGRAARPRVRGGQPPAARGGVCAGGGAGSAGARRHRGDPAAADLQPARHDARRRVQPGDVARHPARQPRRGAAADRGAGGLRAGAARGGGGGRRRRASRSC